MDYLSRLGSDQLVNQKALINHFLTLFEEGPITFPPTYKIGIFQLIKVLIARSTTMNVSLVGQTEFFIEKEVN